MAKSSLGLRDMEAWIARLGETFEREMERLSQLDGALGDGDHGTSMVRAFRAVNARLQSGPHPADISGFLQTVGMTVLSATGGATGPLFGTVFLEAAKAARGKAELTLADLAAMAEAAATGVAARGGARPGEKTMIDALVPAAQALTMAAVQGADLQSGLDAAAGAARAGAARTAEMLAAKGRARYLGERSLGHEDAGANSVALIFRALAEAGRNVHIDSAPDM